MAHMPGYHLDIDLIPNWTDTEFEIKIDLRLEVARGLLSPQLDHRTFLSTIAGASAALMPCSTIIEAPTPTTTPTHPRGV